MKVKDLRAWYLKYRAKVYKKRLGVDTKHGN
jgi:hypothetical protein